MGTIEGSNDLEGDSEGIAEAEGTTDPTILEGEGATVCDLVVVGAMIQGVRVTGVCDGDTGASDGEEVNEKSTGVREAEGTNGRTEGEGAIAVT